MNRIYRVVFNRALGVFQVASETTRAHGKSGGRSPRVKAVAPGASRRNQRLSAAVALALSTLTLPAQAQTLVTSPLTGNAGGNASGAGAGVGAVPGTSGGAGGSGAGAAGSSLAGSGGAGGTLGGHAHGGGGGGGRVATQGNGDGGGASYGYVSDPGGGGGGGGGAGLSLGAGASLTNLNTITGGAGGAGGIGYAGGGGGGGGGAGVFAGVGSTIINTGTIVGGAGGNGGGHTGFYPSIDGEAGRGGTGLLVTGNSTITNGGTIAGAGGANAIELSGGGNTLTLEGGSVINGNVVSSGGDTLALGGSTNGSFNMANVGASAQYRGFNQLQKTGTSTWTLTGANSFSGATTVSAGTLKAGSAGSFSSSSATTVDSGATLDLNNFNQTVGSLAGAGNVTLGSAKLTAGGDNSSTVYSGVISGTGGLTKTGTGTMTLSGANTYTGATTVNAGKLQAGAANVLSSSTAVSVASGATLDLNNFNQTVGSLTGAGNVTLGSATLTTGGDNTSTTYSGVISGTGGLTKTGTGTLTLSGSNSYTGATTVSAGTLKFGPGGNLSAITTMTVASGATVDLNGAYLNAGSLAGAGNVMLTNGYLFTGWANTGTTFSGVLSGNGGLVKRGTGTLTLSGANTYTAGTSISSGTLRAGAANILQSSFGIGVTSGATFDLNDFDQTIGTLQDGGSVTLGSATLTTGSNEYDAVFSGVISGTGGLTKTGSNTQTLSGANTYSGATTINGGRLQIGADNALSSSTAVSVASGATFDLNNFNQTISSLAGAGSVTLGSGTLTTGGGDTSTEFSGVISGTGGLTKTGTGTFTLSGANTYSGATTINNGTLKAGVADALSSDTAVSVASGATFNLNSFNQSIGSLAGAGTVTLGSAVLTTGVDDTDTTFSGVIAGSGSVVKTGTGTLTLSGTNNVTGGTTIEDGTIAVSSSGSLGAGIVTLDGGALRTATGLTIGNTINLDGNGGALDNGGFTSDFGGLIQGTGALTLIGSGTTTLSSSLNDYSGGTTVIGGTLAISSDARLGDSSGGLTLKNGATLKTTAAMTIDRLIALSGGAVINNNGLDITVGNVISGDGGLTLDGSGTTTLAALNTYTGGTTVNDGTVSIDSDDNLGDASGGLTLNGATLLTTASISSARAIQTIGSINTINNGGHSLTLSGVISGDNDLLFSGTGTTTLSGINTYTGDTGISGGVTLAVASDANLGNGGALDLMGGTLLTTADFSSGRTLAIADDSRIDNGGHNATFYGAIEGDAALELTGTGITTFAGGVDTTGQITINANSTLRVNDANVGTVVNNGTLSISANKTLDVGGNFTTTGVFSTTIAGMSSYGKVTVSGTATLGGTLNVDVLNDSVLTAPAAFGSVIHANAIENTFDTITTNSALFDFGAIYTTTDVNLTMTAKPVDHGNSPSTRIESIVDQRGNATAQNAARILGRWFANDSPTAPSELSRRFASLTSDNAVNRAVTQSLPLLTGGSQFAANAAQSGISRLLQARLDSYRGQSSGESFLGDNKVWMKPFGSWADQGDRNGASGYDASVGGMAFGSDSIRSDKTRIGLSFAYAKADVDSNSHVAPNSLDADIYQLTGYGSYSLDANTEIDFQLGGGVNKNHGKRELSEFGLNAKADYNSVTALAGVGIGHTIALNEQLRFTPSVRADYSWIKDESYIEKGAGALNLKVGNRDTDSLILAVDGKVNYAFNSSTNVSVNLGAGYDTLNDRTSITSAYAGAPGAAFTTEGLDLDPWLLRAGVGLAHVVDNGTEISLRYDAEKRNDFLNQTASVKVRWAF